jgi:hypothetical protein
VGLEQRQNTIAFRAATNSSFATGFQDLNLVVASNPSLAKALADLGGNLNEVSQENRIQALGLFRALLHYCSIALLHIWPKGHRRYLNGTLDPALYDGMTQEISTYAGKTSITKVIDDDRRHAAMKWAWESERFIYNSEFQ